MNEVAITLLLIVFIGDPFEMRLLNLRITFFYLLWTFCPHLAEFGRNEVRTNNKKNYQDEDKKSSINKKKLILRTLLIIKIWLFLLHQADDILRGKACDSTSARELTHMKQISFSCLNFWDEVWWFLSLRVFELLSPSLLLFPNVSTDMSSGLLQVFVELGTLHGTLNYVLYWIHGGHLF